MVDRELARKEIFKFGSLHFPPSTQEALGALIDKLAEVSRNENHCRAIVRTILEDPGEGERWPTVKSIGDVAYSLLSDKEKLHGCERCQNTGWISTQRILRGISYDCAYPCHCRPPAPEPEELKKRRTGKLEKVTAPHWTEEREQI